MTAVIVHKGTTFPTYLTDCIEQFFLFNKKIVLYIIVDVEFAELVEIKRKNSNFQIIQINSLKKNFNHKFFLFFNRLTKSTWKGGFWRYVVERFFELEDFMRQHKIEEIIHFEYDNMIYVDFATFTNVFNSIKTIVLPSDCDTRCIPSVVFIPTSSLITKFNLFYNLRYTLFPTNDMLAFSHFRKKKKYFCTTLPVIPKEYADDKKILVSQIGKTAKNNWDYYNFYEKFGGIFDAASFGQYLGGVDTRNTNSESTKGFINESAVYSPADFSIFWEKTKSNLSIPCVQYKDSKKIPLFNLHIHSKDLHEFRSDKGGGKYV